MTLLEYGGLAAWDIRITTRRNGSSLVYIALYVHYTVLLCRTRRSINV